MKHLGWGVWEGKGRENNERMYLEKFLILFSVSSILSQHMPLIYGKPD
jgi:hypothetical protein